MATESVKILIEAEDKATAKLKQATTEQEKAAARAEVSRVKAQKSLAAERIELEQGAEAAHAFRLELEGLSSAEAALIAREKELLAQQKKRAAEQEKLSEIGGAKQTKTGAEFFGAIAGMAGGSEIASVASQIGGLTEKTSQFSEVAKAGGASALLFKAGLFAAAGAIGFEVGQSIGKVIFETDKWTNSLQAAIERTKELDAIKFNNMKLSFSDFVQDLEFADDKGAAVAEKMQELKSQIADLQEQKKAAVANLKSMEAAPAGIDIRTRMVGGAFEGAKNLLGLNAEKQADIELQKLSIATREKDLALLKEEQAELERIIGIEQERDEKRKQRAEEKQAADFLKGIRDEIEMTKAEIAGTANELKAQRGAGATFGGDSEALRLLNELDAAKKLQEERKKAEAEKEQFAQKEKARLDQVDALRKSESTRIEEQIISIEKGKTAAQAFRLEQQGLGKDEAERLALAQAEIDKVNQKGAKPQQLQAVESRLLTRGAGGEDQQKQISESTKKAVAVATQQLQEMKELRRELTNKQALTIKTAS